MLRHVCRDVAYHGLHVTRDWDGYLLLVEGNCKSPAVLHNTFLCLLETMICSVGLLTVDPIFG